MAAAAAARGLPAFTPVKGTQIEEAGGGGEVEAEEAEARTYPRYTNHEPGNTGCAEEIAGLQREGQGRRRVAMAGRRLLWGPAELLQRATAMRWMIAYPKVRFDHHGHPAAAHTAARKPYASAPCCSNAGTYANCATLSRRRASGAARCRKPTAPVAQARLIH